MTTTTMRRTRWRARARRLAVFAIGGGLALTVARAWPQPEPGRPIVTVEVDAGASPGRIHRAIEEAVLVDAALRRGLPWTDPFVRRRLLADLRLADPSVRALADDELLRRARALDLVRVHPVLRARVAETMRRHLRAQTEITPCSDAALRRYFDAHADRYARPAAIDLRQIVLGRARHGDALVDDANELLARLDDAGPEAAAGAGDPSLLPHTLGAATPASLDATFGPGVGAAILAMPVGRWAGPIQGAYGMHLVYVTERRDATSPTLAEVEGRVCADRRVDLRRAAAARAVAALRDEVQVVILKTEVRT